MIVHPCEARRAITRAQVPRDDRGLSYMAGACHEQPMPDRSEILNFRQFWSWEHKVTLSPLDTVNRINRVSTKSPESAPA
jgi:hypothetical protein